MMDPFSFQDELLHGDLLWAFSPEPFDIAPAVSTPPVVRRSAFTPYTRPHGAPPASRPGGATNIHRRVIELVRRIPKAKPEIKAGEHSRGFRHMMRERQRREKLSQSYADLYSMLSSKSKADKNSIVQSAAVRVRELKGVEEELRRRNEELKEKLARGAAGAGAGAEKVKIQVANPSSVIDSMIAALQCLKRMDVKATAIRSDFSDDRRLSAVVSVERNQVSAAELERVVEGAVMEVEQKFRAPFSGWARDCHVENTM